MTDFETILARLEELSPPLDRTSFSGPASFASAWDNLAAPARTADANRNAATIAAAYGTLSPEPGPETKNELQPTPQAARPPTRETLLRELRAAETSIEALRALRRRLAWLCHPDRHGPGAERTENLMAEFNARIDAAIARIRRSTASVSQPRRAGAEPTFRHPSDKRQRSRVDGGANC